MKGKVSMNRLLKVVAPALLVAAIICQSVGFQGVLAKDNVTTASSAIMFQTLLINNYRH